MINYIDEAGSFVIKGALENSWCTVACYSLPEFEKRKLIKTLRDIKITEGYHPDSEMKLKDFSEQGYIELLHQLGKLKGSLFCVATDSFYNSIDKVNSHKVSHLESVMRGKSEMKYAEGEKGMSILHSQLEGLPQQLYIQFHCQAVLLSSFVRRGIAFYVQRFPNSLKKIRWQYDAKERTKLTNYEDSFQKFVPVLLQAYSIDNPVHMMDWCDYAPMQDYRCKVPDYISEKYPKLIGQNGFDLQKIIRDDIKFTDSKTSSGLQIVDLLASGVRRLLRLEFENNELVAEKIGRLLLQEEGNQSPISLVAFDKESPLDKQTSKVIKIMIANCQRLLK